MPARKRRIIRTKPSTRRRYPIETQDPLVRRLYEGPAISQQVDENIGIVRVGGGTIAPLGYGASKIHPYKIVARLKDGRRFELRVNALSSQEAEKIAHEKFPLITIQKISRADKIKTIGGFLSTVEAALERGLARGESPLGNIDEGFKSSPNWRGLARGESSIYSHPKESEKLGAGYGGKTVLSRGSEYCGCDEGTRRTEDCPYHYGGP